MGLLQQASSPIADSYGFTLSVWSYVKSAEVAPGSVYFFEFSNSLCWTGLNTFEDRDFIDGYFNSAPGGATVSRYPAGVPSSGSPDSTDSGTAQFHYQSRDFAPGTLRDKWVHYLIACDMLNYAEYNTTFDPPVDVGDTPFRMPTLKIYINRQNAFDTSYAGAPGTVPWRHFFEYDAPFTPSHSTPPATRPVNIVTPDLSFPHYDIDPYMLNYSGASMAIPLVQAEIGDHPKQRMAEFQMWNKYIDPATYISMFIDSRGKPVNPSIPAATFGPPAILCRRNKKLGKKFEINEGSGGAFTKIGTIGDYSPSPYG